MNVPKRAQPLQAEWTCDAELSTYGCYTVLWNLSHTEESWYKAKLMNFKYDNSAI